MLDNNSMQSGESGGELMLISRSTLFQLINLGSKRRENWEDVISYLDENALENNKEDRKQISCSPLFQTKCTPNRELQKELDMWMVDTNALSPLQLALSQKAPSSVIAALCHMFPHLASIPDKLGQLPIHMATRRPTGGSASSQGAEAHKVMMVLLETFPEAVVHRDCQGRTPLHVLFMYHAESRTVQTVQHFMNPVSRKTWEKHAKVAFPSDLGKDRVIIPYTATSITDTIHGCYPLHYAVMEGSSKEVIQTLLDNYPNSQSLRDHAGRTPLHWYLGAAEGASVYSTPEELNLKQYPKYGPHHKTHRSTSIVSLLLNPNVASYKDLRMKRTPLHCAASLMALSIFDPNPLDNASNANTATSSPSKESKRGRTKGHSNNNGSTPPMMYRDGVCMTMQCLLKIINANFAALTMPDAYGQSPLHVFFSTVHDWNHSEYQELLQIVLEKKMDLQSAQTLTGVEMRMRARSFSPPLELVQLLIYGRSMGKISKKGISMAASEDSYDDDDDEPDGYAIHQTQTPTKKNSSIIDVTKISQDEDDTDLTPTEMSDHFGMLPLHLALLTVIPTDIIDLLIASNPSSMIHTTFDKHKNSGKDKIFKRTPIHLAFSSPYTTSLYTLDTIQPLLIEHQKQLFLRDDPLPNQPNVMVDGKLALEMKDGSGRYPLHLAAENNASLEILEHFYKLFPQAVSSTNRDGDLPVHLVLDKFGLFDNLQLAIAQDESKKQIPLFGSNPFDNQSYTKIVALAKKQHSTNRLSSLGFGGAVIAPIRGWTSDEEDAERKKEKLILLRKLHLLLSPLCDNPTALAYPSSRHNMTPLHIAIAFHCLPYSKIHKMLQSAPQASNTRTKVGQYTPLDLHMLRKRVPGEISPEEKDAWEVIRELLFSYDVYPISTRGVENRRDVELLKRCAKIVRAGIEGKPTFHSKNYNPMDPVHTQLGFDQVSSDVTQSEEKTVDEKEHTKEEVLEDVAKRLWTFFVSFTNASDPKDHYALYVKRILENLDFDLVQDLIYMRLPDYAVHATGTSRNISGLTILDVANVYCKSFIHRCFYFAGLYNFTPPLPSELDHGGSGTGESILLHRGEGGKTLLLRATEFHCFTEEEDVSDGNDLKKAAIHLIDTNEEEGMEVDVNEVVLAGMDSNDAETENQKKANFRITSQGVCVKLIKDASNYEREIKARSILGENNYIIPLLADYDSTSSKREGDRHYNHDISGSRFRNLPLYSCLEKGNQPHSTQIQGPTNDPGNCSTLSKDTKGSVESWSVSKATGFGQGWVDISGYPYSIIMPLASRFNLNELFRHDAINNIDSFRDLTIYVGQALKFMHSKGLIFGNFSMKNLVSVGNLDYNKQKKLHNWLLTDLTCARAMRVEINKKEEANFFGGIPLSGTHSYDCSTFPPEMFTKVDNAALDMYQAYWKTVSDIPNSNVPWSLIKPLVNPITGDKYVIKFFCEMNGSNSHDLPPLPYDLVKCTAAIDVWAFGAFLFTLCSGGQRIISSNDRNGHLDTSWERIVKWNEDITEHLVFEHVEDFVAQDLLLHILVDIEERSDLSMEAVLSHPFFCKPETMSRGMKQALTHILKQRQAEQNERKQSILKIRTEEKESLWAEENLISLNRLTLESQLQFSNSTTGLVTETLDCVKNPPCVPTCLITLPYKLARNKLGKLTPASKRDVQLAEVIGKHIFHLNKACVLTHMIEELIQKKSTQAVEKWVELSTVNADVAAKEIVENLGIQKEHFAPFISSLVTIISTNSDFSSKPLFYCRSIIRKRVKDFVSIFSNAKKAFLYLVDEMNCIPILLKDPEKTAFPYSISDHLPQTVLKLLPFMYACILQTRHTTKSVSGLVRLIFEAAYPHCPPSWTASMAGLHHNIKRSQSVSEVRILCKSIQEILESQQKDEDLIIERISFLKEIFAKIDSEKAFCGLKYVTNGHDFMWTSKSEVEKLEKEGQLDNLNKEYDAIQNTREQLRLKDIKVKELERALKEMKLNKNQADN